MELHSIKIEKLKPAIYNPRKDLKAGDKEYEKIKKSILEFGYIDPIIVNNDYTIIGGHQRYKVLKDLNYNDVQCIILNIDKTKEKALNIALNKISGEWDFPLLKDLIQEIDTGEIDIELTGFDFEEIENMMGQFNVEPEATEDDFEMPKQEEIQTDIKIGDLFEIGEHRLLCGDSTDGDQVAKLMNGEKADMVFTDPPYGVSYQSNMRTKSQKFEILKNDELFITDWINNLPLYSNGFVFVWTSWKVVKEWIEFLQPLGEMTNMIIWDKGGGGIGDLKGTFSSDFEIALVYNRDAKIIGKRLGSVWNVNKDGASTYLHPTQKPVELAAMGIENILEINKIVLDLFCGSGSTMVAAHQLKRKCYGMELDPKYCQVIVDRMKKLDPTLIIKKNGIEVER